MTDEKSAAESLEEKLLKWRQGDYALGVGGFLFADRSETGEAFDARENPDNVAGLVVVSQTCDVVRLTPDKPVVAVSPLVRLDSKQKEIANGRFPSLTTLEHPPAEGIFVDLARIMSVSKELLAGWDRQDGFTSQDRAIRFAAAIERKLGRFAFPDDFDAATKPFQDRVRSRHSKADSPVGRVYRSIDQLRFVASPHWDAESIKVALIAVLCPNASRVATDEEIREELKAVCEGITWPPRYQWAEPAFHPATAGDLSGADILGSQLADFEYLST
ncbi:MAG: hypothetical protein R3C25_00175 [Hyphomonadaceae bacterium]